MSEFVHKVSLIKFDWGYSFVADKIPIGLVPPDPVKQLSLGWLDKINPLFDAWRG
jgi:hypothetical protein